MGNPHRGDVTIELAGRRLTLRLTLGALAEIEEALAAPGLAALGERLSGGLRTSDIIALAGAAVRGGGADLSDEAFAAMVPASDLPRLADALALLMERTFGEPAGADPFPRRG